MFDSHPLAPNLFVTGASKAGTSALHAYLDLHPEIRMSGQKEPCFFVDRADLLQRWAVMAHNTVSHDVDAYLAAFDGGEGMRYQGESSTLYAMHPSISDVAGRIAAACPDARIIYCVREPATRAISHYWQETRHLNEKRSLEVALHEDPIYRYTSDYALQIEQYLAHFCRVRIHVVVSEWLRRDRLTTLAEIFDWLGVALFTPDPEDLADMHVTPSGRQAGEDPGDRRVARHQALAATAQVTPRRGARGSRSRGYVASAARADRRRGGTGGASGVVRRADAAVRRVDWVAASVMARLLHRRRPHAGADGGRSRAARLRRCSRGRASLKNAQRWCRRHRPRRPIFCM